MNAVCMPDGKRVYRTSTLTVGHTTAVPEHMREGMREISSLATPVEDQRKGYATALLHQVTAEADRAAMVLILLPDPYGIDQQKLEEFYARFGFRKIQESPALMARQPVRPRLSIVHAVHEALQ